MHGQERCRKRGGGRERRAEKGTDGERSTASVFTRFFLSYQFTVAVVPLQHNMPRVFSTVVFSPTIIASTRFAGDEITFCPNPDLFKASEKDKSICFISPESRDVLFEYSFDIYTDSWCEVPVGEMCSTSAVAFSSCHGRVPHLPTASHSDFLTAVSVVQGWACVCICNTERLTHTHT